MPTFSVITLLRALLVWLLIIAAESVHGALRRFLFTPEVDFAIRQISVVIGVVIFFAITWVFIDWIRVRTARGALAIGAAWVILTVAFEVTLGRLTGVGWDRIAADYDLPNGGLMPLGLLAMGLTPWLVLRLKSAPRNLRKTP